MSTVDVLREEGKIEGKAEKTNDVIKKCYEKNFDIETIADLVALSIDEVIFILNDLKKK
jgi:hypothetical protein